MPESYSDGLIFQDDENIRLRIPMIAKPAPKIVWFFEDEPISAGSDLIIETTDAYTSLRITGAKRWHCGEFRVYAENEYGEDACSILVTVTCKNFYCKKKSLNLFMPSCTLFWDNTTKFWYENLLLFSFVTGKLRKNLFWTNKKIVYLNIITFCPKITSKNIVPTT